MTQALALEYRPHTFEQVVGQHTVVPVLRAFAKKKTPPPLMIFSGPSAVGKTSMARILGAALNCTSPAPDGDACGVCKQCKAVQGNFSMSYIEIDSATNGKVADVQSIREIVLHTHENDFRIVVFDEAHAITGVAFKSLLKLFEEPPANTVFILVTTDPQDIPKTIQSRALTFDFRIIPLGEVAKRLLSISNELKFDAEPTLLAKIAYNSRGHIRDAIMELDKCYRVGLTSAAEYDKITFTGDFSKDILLAAVHKDSKALYDSVENFFKYSSDLKEFISQFVDSLIALSKAQVGLTVDERTMELSRNISKDQIMKCYEIVWNMQDRGSVVKNPKSQAHLFTEVLVQVL